MKNVKTNKIILETQILQLKKESEGWIGGGFILIIVGIFLFEYLSYFEEFSILFIIFGVIILIKGFNLRKKYYNQVLKRVISDNQMPD